MSLELRRRLMATKFDPIIIDARDGNESNAELMRIISENGWSKNASYMRKSEAERVTDIKTVFKGNTKIKDFTAFQYFINVTNLPAYAFASTYSMTLVLPPNITDIGTSAVNDSGYVIGVLPPNFTELSAKNAFAYNNIKELYFGEKLSSIGTAYYIFNSSKIEKVSVHENNQHFYETQGCIVKSDTKELYISTAKGATIPNEVTSIGDGAMMSRTDISNLVINSKITYIGYYTFAYSGSITSIQILGSCTINNSAFRNCQNLKSIDFGNVTRISSYSFINCSKLTSVILPASCVFIEGSSFLGCTAITSISVDEGNTVYDSRNNCNAIIETKTNTLVIGCKNTIIPSGITTIGNTAFAGSNVVNINIPTGVTTLKGESFSGCKSLQSIILPETIETIDNFSFNGCTALRTITVHAIEPPCLGSNNYNSSVTDVYVPYGEEDSYKASWKQYANVIKAIPQ